MQYFNGSTALVGVSELRTRLADILKMAAKAKVFLGRRSKPLAVILPIERYEHMEMLLDRVEDAVLGYTAKERDRKTKLSDYYTLDEAEKKVGLKK